MSIKSLFDGWKNSLLNLGRNNNLLYFNPSRGLQILYPDIDELFKSILDGAPLTFRKRDADREQLDLFGDVIASRYDIKTSKESSKEEFKRLTKYYKNNRSYNEERGINSLFLSFLFVEWQDINEDINDLVSSPLLLIPVTLEQEGSFSPFVLKIQENEVVVNNTLKSKFNSLFGIELPDFEDDDTLESYKGKCKDVFDVCEHTFKIKDVSYLAIFQYTNLSIYNDLQRNASEILGNNLLRAIAGEEVDVDISMKDVVDDVLDLDFDKQINPESVFQVLDADESQRVAIEMAKRGVSFVLQGPPGTGKSQTIANIIAESIAAGKKVLFVSEKEAALNVVRNRLVEVNLGSFCLAVHSHSTNKKKVIDDLYDSATNRGGNFNVDFRELEALKQKKEFLNGLSEELHRTVRPFGKSVFGVNSLLSQYEDIPDALFAVKRIETKTEDELNSELILINDIIQCISNISNIRFSEYWNECNLNSFSLEQRTTFNLEIDEKLVSNLISIIQIIVDFIGTECEIQYNQIDKFIDFVLYCGSINDIPFNWDTINIDEIKVVAQDLSEKQRLVRDDDQLVTSLFDYDVKDFDVELLSSLIENVENIIKSQTENLNFNKDSSCSIIDLNNIHKKVSEWVVILKELISLDGQQSILSLNWQERSVRSFCQLKEYVHSINKEMDISYNWMSLNSLIEIERLVDETDSKLQCRKENKKIIDASFDEGIYDVDAKSFLHRFRSEYDNFLRIFKSSYRRDVKVLKGFCKNGKLKYEDMLRYLSSLQTIKESEKWVDDNKALYEKYNILVNSYTFESEKYKSYVQNVRLIVQFFFDKTPKSVQDFVVGKKCVNNKQLSDAIVLLSKLEESGVLQANERIECFGSLLDIASQIENAVSDCLNILRELEKHQKCELSNFGFIPSLLRWQSYVNYLESRSHELECMFGKTNYNGKSTDWALIQQKIQWFEQYILQKTELGINDSFTTRLLTDSIIAGEAHEVAEITKQKFASVSKNIDWFNNWFENSHSLYTCSINRILAIVLFYRQNIEKLDNYLLYKAAIKRAGGKLEDFISKVVVVDNKEYNYLDYDKIYLKRFYTLWIDAVLDNSKINRTSIENIDSCIKEFKQLDKRQFKIASSRINKLIKENLPDFSFTFGANSETRILQKQHSLSRKHMPLRKLFNAIPNLILATKPCLMMSPISVSIFLENPIYKFDIVIFDEASQIKPEYSIGSIIRGKQLIVAGDNKQLPPTSFFNVSNYNDQDQNEESVLDLCNSVLCNSTLRWHYRSKHEDLITISNLYMYNKDLVTFPSKYANVSGYGVEYKYVNDWQYEEGKNIPEAKIVAELVFEHFRKYGDSRSLGVITNNIHQVEIIEDAIFELRENNHEYDSLFDEKRHEKFFVKNLENVQGDERDTIIYSICYGKNKDGKVAQNFGPINQVGGERRLNVAITRAKYNLKVVTSLTADDIHIPQDRDEITGPKLLKLFLDFAKRGNASIHNLSNIMDEPEFDSPFEESVYNFLISKNYSVDTQVGSVGYRIDLGVKDPNNPNQYVLAIECDGATYHSAKYARERDRLRQEVLENMGWKFYRIWSTDWIKHPEDAKRRLVNKIEKAISHSDETNDRLPDEGFDCENADMVLEDGSVPILNDKPKFEFEQLISKSYYLSFYTTCDGILEIIANEEPLSRNRLYKLLLEAFDRQMVTEHFKRRVDERIDDLINKENKVIDKNGFLYLVPVKQEYPFRLSHRNVNDISDEEFAFLIKVIIKNNFSMNFDDICLAETKIMKVGQSNGLYEKTLRALRYLVDEKMIVLCEHKYSLATS